MADSTLNPAELRDLAVYLSGASGIELDESKGYLFEARLQHIADEQGCKSLTQLLDKTRRDATGKLREVLVDAVTTHETSFFREPQHFDLLAHKLVPDHFETTDPKRLRVWCAASSTGQEVYSLVITLKELLGNLAKYNIQIVGTDISSNVLERASRGVYTQLEVSRGLSPDRLKRYFTAKGKEWAILDELRSVATYQRGNLLENAPSLGTFDIVLCRNVAIYFSPANRAKMLANIAARLRRGGVLLTSATENLGVRPEPFLRREYRGVCYYERS
jgi:chemotaxis protein methyltransferase CheR